MCFSVPFRAARIILHKCQSLITLTPWFGVAILIENAVIAAAGLGTRLMSATKEQPKEMLPLFAASEDEAICLKPIVQQIFEQLFDFGLRQFYFIVGRGKRAIEDHFTPDHWFVGRLNTVGKGRQVLEAFYRRIEESCIIWVNQPEPRGFGAAVLQAEPFHIAIWSRPVTPPALENQPPT